MKFDLTHKVIIITGASSGIGAALALHLARKKTRLMLAARNSERLLKIAESCSHHTEVRVCPTDVTQESDCERLIASTIETYGQLDVLICNAGLSMRGLVEDTDKSVIKQLMDVNFWGSFYCTQLAMPHLLKSKGMLVGISSISGFKALPGRSAYTASKHAMNGFLECVKIENLKTGVHVLTICPGFTSTNIRKSALNANGQPQQVSPRNEDDMMAPNDVARNITQAIVNKKDFVVLSKQGRIMYWLNKFVPNFISKKVYDEFAKEPNSPLRIEPLK